MTWKTRSLLPCLTVITLLTTIHCGSSSDAKSDVPLSKPVIVQEPQDLRLDVGLSGQFMVEARGSNLTYRWTKNAGEVVGQSPVLKVGPVQLKDHGTTYQVTVSNASGTATSRSAVLSINTAPAPLALTYGPERLSVDVGGTTRFEVQATGGTPPYRYAWRFGNTPLPNTGAMLELTNVQANQAGVYAVTVTDSSSPAQSASSREATLSVNTSGPAALALTYGPERLSVDVGGTARFEVQATGGTPPYRYAWRFGNTALTNTSAILELTNVQANQAGVYAVTVTDSSSPTKSASSREATLSVNATGPTPLQFTTPLPATKTVSVGSHVRLGVAVSGGTPPYHYQWQHDSTPIGTDSANLELLHVQTRDAGSYTVTITDASDTPKRLDSAPSVLTVQEVSAGSILVDHTCTDISRIPAAYLRAAKTNLRIAYQHTSHGSHMRSGMAALRVLGAPFDYQDEVDITNSGYHAGVFLNDYFNEDESSQGTGIHAWDLGYPYVDDTTAETPWSQATRALLSRAGGCDRNVVIWSWCSMLRDQAHIQQYLDNMAALEAAYPSVKFVYMTGALDTTGNNADINARNEQIRSWCRTGNRILFDYADIESFDPDGLRDYSQLNGTDGCYFTENGVRRNWAQAWINAHPDAPLTTLTRGCEGCRHSDEAIYDNQPPESEPEAKLNCILKGRAFWWLLARLAGWDGTAFSEAAPDSTFRYAQASVAVAGSLQTHHYHFKAPSTYNADKSKAYPLVLYLHPSGFSNDPTNLHEDAPYAPGYITDLTRHATHPAFVYVPVCPPPYGTSGAPSARNGGEWNSPAARTMIVKTIRDLCRRFNIDRRRIYVTGFSMGGAGTYYIADAFHLATGSRVAAMSRSAGYSPALDMTSIHENAARSPVWIHVGGNDTGMDILSVCQASYAFLQRHWTSLGGVETVTERRAANGLVAAPTPSGLVADVNTVTLANNPVARLSVYRGQGHGESLMYQNADLFDWLFSQVLPDGLAF